MKLNWTKKTAKKPEEQPADERVVCRGCKFANTDKVMLGRRIDTGEPFMCYCDKLDKFEFLDEKIKCEYKRSI